MTDIPNVPNTEPDTADLGARCAEMVRQHATEFRPAADWLQSLNTEGDAWPETAGRIVRAFHQIEAGLDGTPDADRPDIISSENARKLIVLGALVFDRGFTGEELDLTMEWHEPAQNEKTGEEPLADSRLQAKHMLQSQPGTVGVLARDIEYALQIVAAELANQDGEKVNESAETAQSTDRASGKGKRTRVEVKSELVKMQAKGKPFTSQADMAVRLGCAPGTVNKALHDSDNLKAWADVDQPAEDKAKPKHHRLSDVDIASKAQSREADPADKADESATLDDLVNQAPQEQRKETEEAVNGWAPEQRRDWAEWCENNPDAR